MVAAPVRHVTVYPQIVKDHINKVYKDKPILHDVGIRTNEWKLIHRRNRLREERSSIWMMMSGKKLIRSEYELFNLKTDPFEKKNVFKDFPLKGSELKTKILDWEKQVSGENS